MRNRSTTLESRHCYSCFIILLALLAAAMTPVQAQGTGEKSEKAAKLFSSTDVLPVTIDATWRDLVVNKSFQGTYPAKMHYTDVSGKKITLNLTVERRGIKRQEVCRYPPIKLRFDKEEVKGTMFRGQKSIKMVTHCDRGSRYEQYYVLEMLIYRIYNLITDYSFRVRPLDVTYVDTKTGSIDPGRFAFLIEDDSDVAKRHDLKKLKIPRISSRRLEPGLTSEMVLFQYLVGNVDWAALSGPDPEECCHNIKLIAPRPLQAGDLIYPVPYDFDSSGLVNADYAAPPGGLPISKVTQRLYRGYCSHNSDMEQARSRILDQEDAIMTLLANEPLLSSGKKKSAGRYLERGFKELKNPKSYDKRIMEKCRR